MQLSKEMRRLQGKWEMGTGWPKRLDAIHIDGLRGWEGQRFNLGFPIMAIVGENGSGKSTVLQCAASVYKSVPAKPKFRWASDFFLDTTWDRISRAEIKYILREGAQQLTGSIRKPTDRWRGNPERRVRNVEYIDLSRIQPIPARTGYTKLANPQFEEVSAIEFEKARLERLNEIMGRHYDLAKMALTEADANRVVPVLSQQGRSYSGFHQGAGETTVAELLRRDLPQYSLVLIDEIESSLHPRAQRRLMRDLAEKCRENELQVVLTTHSPYVLEELPLEARAYILQGPNGGREIIYGVSPEFAMSKMDEFPHYECDLYVEDERAARMLIEILTAHDQELALACQTIPYGAASVGKALGEMVAGNRFPRPSCVFLDGDRGPAPGCELLPGDDAPERVVFDALRDRKWAQLHERIGRDFPEVADACGRAMALADHHDWLRQAASRLVLSADTLWQAMCAEWAKKCLVPEDAKTVAQPIRDMMLGAGLNPAKLAAGIAEPVVLPEPEPIAEPEPPTEPGQLF
jgi:predicted ATPase